MRLSSYTNEAKLPLTTIMYPMGYKGKLLKRAGNKYAPYFGSWRNTSAGVCETLAQ
jgi:hypothetical protein